MVKNARGGLMLLALVIPTFVANAEVVVYDGSVMPESAGWQREGTFDSDRWIDDGWFCQLSELGEWEPGPIGEMDFYRRSSGEFAGPESFFVEWVVATDVPASVLDVSGVPTVVAVGGTGRGFYHTTVTNERVQLFRSTTVPLVFVDIEPGVAHKYRLELTTTSFTWLIDGEVVDTGVPLGPYPNVDSWVIWGSEYDSFPNNCSWDYLVVPEKAILGRGDDYVGGLGVGGFG
ncbi:MAG: hypothetical protein KJ749_11265, partial [Planctomycetes bacterium]|nr:hypothetical protein [Planctomycetota bacterium]